VGVSVKTFHILRSFLSVEPIIMANTIRLTINSSKDMRSHAVPRVLDNSWTWLFSFCRMPSWLHTQCLSKRLLQSGDSQHGVGNGCIGMPITTSRCSSARR